MMVVDHGRRFRPAEAVAMVYSCMMAFDSLNERTMRVAAYVEAT